MSEETTETTTNREPLLPSFHACICSCHSSKALFWPNTFLYCRHPANLCLQHLPYLTIEATPSDSIGDRAWLWYRGPGYSKAIYSHLNFFFFLVWWVRLALLDTAETRREPGSNYTHPHMFSFTLQRHTHTLFYPRLCFLFRVSIKHS